MCISFYTPISVLAKLTKIQGEYARIYFYFDFFWELGFFS